MAKSNNPAVVGVEDVIKNMAAVKKFLGPSAEQGLKLAGLYLQRRSQMVVPVDTGVLKASAYTRAEGSLWSTMVFVGYTALYAMWVHENVEMKNRGKPRRPPHKGNYWDPAGIGQAKFLEGPARDPQVRAEMFKIFQNTCQAKGGRE